MINWEVRFIINFCQWKKIINKKKLVWHKLKGPFVGGCYFPKGSYILRRCQLSKVQIPPMSHLFAGVGKSSILNHQVNFWWPGKPRWFNLPDYFRAADTQEDVDFNWVHWQMKFLGVLSWCLEVKKKNILQKETYCTLLHGIYKIDFFYYNIILSSWQTKFY